MPPEELTDDEKALMSEMEQDNEPVTEEEQEASRAAEPEPEKAEEPAQEAPAAEPVVDAPAEPAKPPEGFVPHSAMHQERERRKALEREIAELRAAQQQPKAPEAGPPDPILDPAGHSKWLQDQFAAQQTRWVQQEQQQLAAQEQQRLMQQVVAQEQQFVARTPDYEESLTFLKDNRTAELRMYGATDEQAREIIRQEANALVQNALAMGQNPAEVAYNVARHRGYATKAAQQAAQATAADQMAAKAAAQRNTGSLSTAGGPAVSGGHTMETLAAMSEAELAKVPREVKDRVFRGG